MVGNIPLTGYNLIIGVLTGIGLLYFRYTDPTVTPYRRLPLAIVSGVLLFLIGGPIAELVFHSFVHWVHALSSFLVILGLYDLVQNNGRQSILAETVLKDPAGARRQPDWMLPIDEQILHLFHSTELVFSPSIIAYNIEYSRSEVNRRLIELESHGFIAKVDRGKYCIDNRGEQHLQGPVTNCRFGRLESKLS